MNQVARNKCSAARFAFAFTLFLIAPQMAVSSDITQSFEAAMETCRQVVEQGQEFTATPDEDIAAEDRAKIPQRYTFYTSTRATSYLQNAPVFTTLIRWIDDHGQERLTCKVALKAQFSPSSPEVQGLVLRAFHILRTRLIADGTHEVSNADTTPLPFITVRFLMREKNARGCRVMTVLTLDPSRDVLSVIVLDLAAHPCD